jgi:hypothetical protein
MRTKTNARTVARAEQTFASHPTRNTSFASGLLLGLSAASLFLTQKLPRPMSVETGIEDDWKAVAQDFHAAMSQRGK